MIDNLAALRARDDLLAVAASWEALRARLRPSGGNGTADRVQGTSEPRLPIDLPVSDLLHSIETHARFLGKVLLEETHDFTPTTSAMPQLLVEVAHRYGHFTADPDLKIVFDFCDEAHELRRKVSGTLAKHEPARWQGDEYFGGLRGYGGFRVGTGMGLASDDYMRPTFGRSFGDASGYGSRGGYDLGTHQRDVGRSFRGLGPQSYKRPDERIRDDVHERLTESHMIDARYILVDVNQGNVTLTGTVSERRMRYAAEDLVEGVMGVANIDNQLQVQREGPSPSGTGTPAASDDPSEDKRH